MIFRDILRELHLGILSSQQADAVFDELMDSSNSSKIKEILGISPQEWTAFGQGASLSLLAKWRYEGWPNSCRICGKAIEFEKYGWFLSGDGMRHLHCPK